MRTFLATLAVILPIAACSGGGGHDEHSEHHGERSEHMDHPALTGGYEGAVKGDGHGVEGVTASGFAADGPHGMMLRVDVEGLGEGFHGIHVHKIGNCSDAEAGFKASGGHLNPEGKKHGLMNPEGYEAADLPNVYAHSSGHARAELFVAGVGLADALDEDGFAVVVHQNADDHISQPIGGAGPRKACIAFTR